MWVFDLDPGGEATINAIFNPFGRHCRFHGQLACGHGLGLRGGCAWGMQQR